MIQQETSPLSTTAIRNRIQNVRFVFVDPQENLHLSKLVQQQEKVLKLKSEENQGQKRIGLLGKKNKIVSGQKLLLAVVLKTCEREVMLDANMLDICYDGGCDNQMSCVTIVKKESCLLTSDVVVVTDDSCGITVLFLECLAQKSGVAVITISPQIADSARAVEKTDDVSLQDDELCRIVIHVQPDLKKKKKEKKRRTFLSLSSLFSSKREADISSSSSAGTSWNGEPIEEYDTESYFNINVAHLFVPH